MTAEQNTSMRVLLTLGANPSLHALRVLKGERKATEFLTRLHAQQADPDELALIVAALYGHALRGFYTVITKSLRAVRGAS